MSDLTGVLLQPFGAAVSRKAGGRRMRWPLRVLPGVAACGLAGLLIAGLLEPRAPEPAAPELALSPWVEASASMFGLEATGFSRAPRAEAWTRRQGPGRQDVLTFGEGPGEGAWLRLAILQAGPLDPAPGSFYLDLTRAAARAGVAVTRASLPDLLATRFGGFETADVELADGEGARACLGFRLLAGEPDLRLLGFACGRERQPERAALACTLDGLRLLAPEADSGLARFFAQARSAHGLEPHPGCDAGRATAKMIRRP